ncbi:MAG: hypothetical protein V4596_00120 [Bdellovibrionota bacterium]
MNQLALTENSMNQENHQKNELREKAISFGKLAALLGFMAFLYINLLAGGVITVGVGAIFIRMITGQ